MKLRITMAATAAAILLAAAPVEVQAQDSTKPGGLNKVARNVSKTFKKAGRDTKAEGKRVGSKTHNALTDAGNDTKAELKRATGIEAPQSHQPGGLNKVARNVSKTFKKAGSDTKAEKNRVKSKAHDHATETGKSLKDTTLKAKP